MKIAVCLRGHMRTYKKFRNYIHDLKKNHKVDVFVNTWEDLGYFAWDITKAHQPTNPGTINLSSGLVNVDHIKEFYGTEFVEVEPYEAKRAEFESIAARFAEWYEFIKEDPTVDLSRIQGFISQLYKEQAVIRQKNKYGSGDYDIVVETRPDIAMNIQDTMLDDIVQSNIRSVWVNSLNFDYATELKAAWVCNSFFVGKEEVVDLMGSLYTDIIAMQTDHFETWKQTKDPGTYARMFCIHRLCWYYLNSKGVEMIADGRLNANIIR